MLKTGIKGSLAQQVTPELTAQAMGSGGLEVYATPAMCLLMEATAYQSVQPYLAEGEGTVGTLLNIQHMAPTPVGEEVRCESTLVEIDRKRLVFEVEVFDSNGCVGRGRHERFVVQNERFMEKAASRLQSEK